MVREARVVMACSRPFIVTSKSWRETAPDVCGLRLYVEQHNHNAQQIYQRSGLTRTAYEVMELEFHRPQEVPDA